MSILTKLDSSIAVIVLFIIISMSGIYFDSTGPILVTLIGTAIFAVIISGIRLKTRAIREFIRITSFKSSMVSQIGPFIIYHSHHSERLQAKGKEFRIGKKIFCTGCYGIFFGIFIMEVIGISYLYSGINPQIRFLLTFTLPLWFVPIILRYAKFRRMRSPIRFIANMFVPIGCGVLLLVSDSLFENWIINGICILFFFLISYIRVKVSKRENQLL